MREELPKPLERNWREVKNNSYYAFVLYKTLYMEFDTYERGKEKFTSFLWVFFSF